MRMALWWALAAYPFVYPGHIWGEEPAKVVVDNSVAKCVALRVAAPEVRKNLFLLPARIEVRVSIAECGCRSGAIQYRAYETYQGRRREMNRGLLNSMPRINKIEDIDMVLSSDDLIKRRPPFSVDIGCGD